MYEIRTAPVFRNCSYLKIVLAPQSRSEDKTLERIIKYEKKVGVGNVLNRDLVFGFREAGHRDFSKLRVHGSTQQRKYTAYDRE